MPLRRSHKSDDASINSWIGNAEPVDSADDPSSGDESSCISDKYNLSNEEDDPSVLSIGAYSANSTSLDSVDVEKARFYAKRGAPFQDDDSYASFSIDDSLFSDDSARLTFMQLIKEHFEPMPTIESFEESTDADDEDTFSEFSTDGSSYTGTSDLSSMDDESEKIRCIEENILKELSKDTGAKDKASNDADNDNENKEMVLAPESKPDATTITQEIGKPSSSRLPVDDSSTKHAGDSSTGDGSMLLKSDEPNKSSCTLPTIDETVASIPKHETPASNEITDSFRQPPKSIGRKGKKRGFFRRKTPKRKPKTPEPAAPPKAQKPVVSTAAPKPTTSTTASKHVVSTVGSRSAVPTMTPKGTAPAVTPRPAVSANVVKDDSKQSSSGAGGIHHGSHSLFHWKHKKEKEEEETILPLVQVIETADSEARDDSIETMKSTDETVKSGNLAASKSEKVPTLVRSHSGESSNESRSNSPVASEGKPGDTLEKTTGFHLAFPSLFWCDNDTNNCISDPNIFAL